MILCRKNRGKCIGLPSSNIIIFFQYSINILIESIASFVCVQWLELSQKWHNQSATTYRPELVPGRIEWSRRCISCQSRTSYSAITGATMQSIVRFSYGAKWRRRLSHIQQGRHHQCIPTCRSELGRGTNRWLHWYLSNSVCRNEYAGKATDGCISQIVSI